MEEISMIKKTVVAAYSY